MIRVLRNVVPPRILSAIEFLSRAGILPQSVADCGARGILRRPLAGRERASCAKNSCTEPKSIVEAVLARRMQLLCLCRGPRSPPHRTLKWGLRPCSAVRSIAPDPHRQDRALLSGQRPHFFLFRDVFSTICPGFWPLTLDYSGPGALLCGVPRGRDSACGRVPPDPSGQRSFNWQSTAFVMRGLWVRFPPLALNRVFRADCPSL